MDFDSVRQILDEQRATESLDIRGFHVHIGSQITEVEPYAEALNIVVEFISEVRKNGTQVDTINVGSGSDLTILELAETIARVVEFQGNLTLDPSKPDGTPKKLMAVSRLNALGWRAMTGLDAGLQKAYAWFREHVDGPEN